VPDYLFLMHKLPAGSVGTELASESYFARLRVNGRFRGGSAIGGGICAQKTETPPGLTEQLSGFIRVRASDLDDAQTLLAGNPVFERGGVIEIRELPTDSSPAHSRDDAREGDKGAEKPLGIEDRSIDDASFHDCSMVRSRFDDVNLSGSIFTDVNLRGATLDNVNLTGVSVTDANIEGLTIFGHDIQALLRAEITRADK
jgi:uncharacterized protein YjbI with pentapeptide repeats